MAASIARPLLVIIWPEMVYAAMLTMDCRYIMEPAPIMRRHAAPGTPTRDVIDYYESKGARTKILRDDAPGMNMNMSRMDDEAGY